MTSQALLADLLVAEKPIRRNGLRPVIACAGNYHDVGAAVQSMMETACAIDAMDLVLTVDASVAHVAAAMGKPTWLLLPAFADWRWHFVREDSPWYPSMKLFRRQFSGDWAEVVARVNGQLLGLVGDFGR